MFSALKHSLHGSEELDNPITQHYRVYKPVGSAGSECVWRIHDATRIKDNYPASVFVFEKRHADKLHKPKRKDLVTDVLRKEVEQLGKLRHPKFLKVYHGMEESYQSMAFATEPLIGSLANFLGLDKAVNENQDQRRCTGFLEYEIKYGLLQICEAISFLHNVEHVIHTNLSPPNILITRRGMWRLGGVAFLERYNREKDSYNCTAWNPKVPKMAQPDLDFLAPEYQFDSARIVTPLSDMYSFAMLICSVYNDGRSLIQANHNTATYGKLVGNAADAFSYIAPRLPLSLIEPVEKMINKDVKYRLSAQRFMQLKWFDDPVSRCMQHYDAVFSKDLSHKCAYFTKLAQSISMFPRNLLYTAIFPMVREQLDASPDNLILVLPTLLNMVEFSSQEDYNERLRPELVRIFNMNGRPIQATVYLFERLDIIMDKTSEADVRGVILPMIFQTLESNSMQAQEGAIGCFTIIQSYIDEQTMRRLVLPKAKLLFNKSNSVRIRLNALACVNTLIDSLDRMMILDDIIPFMIAINCSDVEIVMSVVSIYKHLLSDKKFGLTTNLLAAKVMPQLIPQTMNNGLDLEQFSFLMEVLREMLDQVERKRRNKIMDEVVDQALAGPDEAVRSTSMKMRNSHFDPVETDGGKFLGVDGSYNLQRHRTSSPDLATRRNSQESLLTPNSGGRAYKRHSSFQGLGLEEKQVLEKVVRETAQRRASLCPGTGGGSTPSFGAPQIMVSEPSCQDFQEMGRRASMRRPSTSSIGPPIITPDTSRRDSKGRVLETGFNPQRRSSFQGLCESAMQLLQHKA